MWRLPGVAKFGLETADMVLGVDYLRSHRVWVSYRSGELFIQSVHSGS